MCIEACEKLIYSLLMLLAGSKMMSSTRKFNRILFWIPVQEDSTDNFNFSTIPGTMTFIYSLCLEHRREKNLDTL